MAGMTVSANPVSLSKVSGWGRASSVATPEGWKRPRNRLTPKATRVMVIASIGLTAIVSAGLGAGAAASEAPTMAGESTARAIVTVQAGDSLWTIAERTNPGVDPRATMKRYLEVNGSKVMRLLPGDELVVPGN